MCNCNIKELNKTNKKIKSPLFLIFIEIFLDFIKFLYNDIPLQTLLLLLLAPKFTIISFGLFNLIMILITTFLYYTVDFEKEVVNNQSYEYNKELNELVIIDERTELLKHNDEQYFKTKYLIDGKQYTQISYNNFDDVYWFKNEIDAIKYVRSVIKGTFEKDEEIRSLMGSLIGENKLIDVDFNNQMNEYFGIYK